MLLQVHLHQAQLIAAVAAAQEIQKRAEIPAQGAAVADPLLDNIMVMVVTEE
jgi:hypothetical protein